MKLRLLGAFALVILGSGVGSAVGVPTVAHAAPLVHAAPLLRAETGDPVPYYVVQPNVDGQPEFLFEIAQRFLRDGNRFPEIFDLNKGRVQPNGDALTEPTSLEPGWVLQLPADAKGDGLQVGPLPGGGAVHPAPSTQKPTPTPTPTPTDRPSKPATPAAHAPASQPETDAASSPGAPVLIWVVIAILVVAGGVAAYLLQRRRRGSGAAPAPRFVTVDRSASWTIDSALRIVTAACLAEDIRFPGVFLITIDAETIRLLLSSPSTRVPVGWSPSPDGRTWTAPLSALQRQQVPEVDTQQFAGFAGLGATADGRMLVDFRAARGVISIDGPDRADVRAAMLSELTGNPWSGSPTVVRVGPRDEPLDAFLARTRGTDAGIAILDEAPSRSQLDTLRARFAAPDFGWIVLVTGPVTGAVWKFTAKDGVLTSGFLPDVHYPSGADLRATV